MMFIFMCACVRVLRAQVCCQSIRCVKLADVLNLSTRYIKPCIIIIYALNNKITPLLIVFSFVNMNDAVDKLDHHPLI